MYPLPEIDNLIGKQSARARVSSCEIYLAFAEMRGLLHAMRYDRPLLELHPEVSSSGRLSHVFLASRQRGIAATGGESCREERGGRAGQSRATRSGVASPIARRRLPIVINRDDPKGQS